jgi:hypothetical protein
MSYGDIHSYQERVLLRNSIRKTLQLVDISVPVVLKLVPMHRRRHGVSRPDVVVLSQEMASLPCCETVHGLWCSMPNAIVSKQIHGAMRMLECLV